MLPSLVWYGRQDLNLHGCPLEPKSNVSANSTTPAYFTLYVFRPVAVPCVRLGDGAPALHTDRGHSLRSLHLPQAALPSLPYNNFTNYAVSICKSRTIIPQDLLFGSPKRKAEAKLLRLFLVCQAWIVVFFHNRNLYLFTKQVSAYCTVQPGSQRSYGRVENVLCIVKSDIIHRVYRGKCACCTAPAKFCPGGV